MSGMWKYALTHDKVQPYNNPALKKKRKIKLK